MCQQIQQGIPTTAACAECEVTTRWMGFVRIWQGSGEAFDMVDLFLPDVQFTTQAWRPFRQTTSPLAAGWCKHLSRWVGVNEANSSKVFSQGWLVSAACCRLQHMAVMSGLHDPRSTGEKPLDLMPGAGLALRCARHVPLGACSPDQLTHDTAFLSQVPWCPHKHFV